MDSIRIEDIAKATDGRIIKGDPEGTVGGVVHDSRECGPDDLFVCVVGENLDGHDFIPQVTEAGCRAILASDEAKVTRAGAGAAPVEGVGAAPGEGTGATPVDDASVILVDDTVEAMGKLAKWYLESLDLITVAVTGSVGKTSTRDMIYYLLNEKFKWGRNLKNYNNEIGLPLSIFRLDSSYDGVVLEMGMSDFGEIRRLSAIVRPTVGVITNIGTAHMEHLGSRQGIFRAKMEITENLRPKDEGGTMVVAFDEEFLNPGRVKGDYEAIFAGEEEGCDYRIAEIWDEGIEGVSFSLEHEGRARRFNVPVPGSHNAVNASLAIAIGDRLGLDDEQIEAGLAKAKLTGHRLRVVEGNGLTVIDDTYNASPASMKAGLKVLDSSKCECSRIAILGEMYEQGSDEEKMHREVGIYAAGCSIDRVIGIGPLARSITDGAASQGMEAIWFETKEDFLREKDEHTKAGDLILVKASRGMKLEEIVDALVE